MKHTEELTSQLIAYHNWLNENVTLPSRRDNADIVAEYLADVAEGINEPINPKCVGCGVGIPKIAESNCCDNCWLSS